MNAPFRLPAAYKPKPAASPQRRKRVSATRAKVLTPAQIEWLLDYVRQGDHPERDTALVMLSFGCGLRAQEIAGLKWKRNVLGVDGKVGAILSVTEDIGKRTVAREIPIKGEVRHALMELRRLRPDDPFVIYPLVRYRRSQEARQRLAKGECAANTLVQYLRRLYIEVQYQGCTSHSGRRTFITTLARRCNEAKASLRDVQILAGHQSLATTEAYIEPSDTQHLLVDLAF